VTAFTSDLSTSDVALLGTTRPLKQVFGTCFYYLGFRGSPRSAFTTGVWPGYPRAKYGELWSLTRAWNAARGSALARLADEARAAGADAVVGLRLERSSYEWSRGALEFVVSGTAVAEEAMSRRDDVVVTSLSCPELVGLARHGYRPVGLVAESTATYVLTGAKTSYAYARRSGKWLNQELSELSRAPYEARRNVFGRVEATARSLQAIGLVGVRIQQHLERLGEGHDLLVTLHVVGAAIAGGARRAPERPTLTLALGE
jgi:uncharacterized protein YbjQ (UPF0145 family)